MISEEMSFFFSCLFELTKVHLLSVVSKIFAHTHKYFQKRLRKCMKKLDLGKDYTEESISRNTKQIENARNVYC